MQLRPRQRTFDSRASAKAAGADRYETGKACRHGHLAFRFTSNGMCSACTSAFNTKMVVEGTSRERARRFRLSNPDSGKLAQQRHWALHAKAITAKRNAKHLATPGYFAAIARRYRAKHRDQHRAYMRSYYRQNPGVFIASAAARRARLLCATPGWADQKAIAAVYRRCAEVARATGVEHHVDHDIPLRHPLVCGLHVAANLRILTAAANRAKSNRWSPENAA